MRVLGINAVFHDPAAAQARRAVRARYHLDRFLADWDRLLEETTCGSR